MGLSLRKNISWTVVGSTVYAGCQWGIIASIAKIGSAEMVGQFALGLAICSPIVLFVSLNLRSVQATDVDERFSFNQYLGLRLVSMFLAAAIIPLFLLVFEYDGETVLVVMLVGLSKLIEAICDVNYGLFQKKERMDLISKSQIIRGVLSLLVTAVAIYVSGDLYWGVWGLSVSWLLVLVLFDLPNTIAILKGGRQNNGFRIEDIALIKPEWELGTIRRLAWLAFPLGMATVASSLAVNVPRYFIEMDIGLEQLGYFAAISYFLLALDIVVRSMGTAAMPTMANYFSRRSKQYFRLLCKMSGMALLLGAIAITLVVFFGDIVLTIVYTSEYALFHSVFIWMVVVAAFSGVATIMSLAATASRLFKKQMIVHIASLVCISIASMLLIPDWGLMGAVVAIGVGVLVRILLLTLFILLSLRGLNRSEV